MDFRTAYLRRREKASHREQRIGAIAMLSVTTGIAVLLAPDLMASRHESSMSMGSSLTSAPASGSSSARLVAAQHQENTARISEASRFPAEAHGPSEAQPDTALASASSAAEGTLVATAADLNTGEGGSGSRYPLGYFPDGAGLVQPAGSPASMRFGMPPVPQADRSALYDMSTGNRISPITPGSASETGPAAAPGVGVSNDGPTGSGGETVQAPDGGNTPATGGSDAPASGNPSAAPAPGAGNPSSPPTPEAGPELPPQGPATPAVPLPPAGGDIELPATPTGVPEPGTLWLSGTAVATLLWLRRNGMRAGR